MVQNSGLSYSKQGIKIYKVDNKLGSNEWFDHDLWTCDLKINRDHLRIEGNLETSLVLIKGQGQTTFLSAQYLLTPLLEHVT